MSSRELGGPGAAAGAQAVPADRAVHDPGATRRTGTGVRGGILRTEIGFRLGNQERHSLVAQPATYEVRSNLNGRAPEKSFLKLHL